MALYTRSMQRARFESLDALRGLAILGMAWASMLPDTLPSWMYHAQEPPPNHIFNDRIFGLTWVDLVFPFFLFSMGVAIPIALSKRLESASARQVVLGLAGRVLMLALFSLYGEHLRPGEWSSTPGPATYWVSVFGFVLLLLMFVRWRLLVPLWPGRILTCAGWIGATLLIATHVYPDGNRGFENSRVDVILMVLANVAVSGGIVWMLTRCRPWWRFGAMAAVALIFLTSPIQGSVGQAIWNFTPLQFFDLAHWPYGRFVPIFYHFEYHKYLLIVLPGTICGDMALRALRSSEQDEDRGWRWPGLVAVAALGLGASVIACWGMSQRYVEGTTIGLLAIGAGLVLVTLTPQGAMERFVAWLCRLGLGTVMLGCLAEPIGGGIRKDEPTLSYFILTAGLAIWVLAALASVFDIARQGRRLTLLTYTGANPILAYVTITNLIVAVDGLAGYTAWLGAGLADHPWAIAFLGGGVETAFVALLAYSFTRMGVFLRA